MTFGPPRTGVGELHQVTRLPALQPMMGRLRPELGRTFEAFLTATTWCSTGPQIKVRASPESFTELAISRH